MGWLWVLVGSRKTTESQANPVLDGCSARTSAARLETPCENHWRQGKTARAGDVVQPANSNLRGPRSKSRESFFRGGWQEGSPQYAHWKRSEGQRGEKKGKMATGSIRIQRSRHHSGEANKAQRDQGLSCRDKQAMLGPGFDMVLTGP